MKKTISTKLSDAELAQLDATRGAVSVAEFVRSAVLDRIAGERREGSEIARTLAKIEARISRIEEGGAQQNDMLHTRDLLVAFVQTTTKNAEAIRANRPGLLPD